MRRGIEDVCGSGLREKADVSGFPEEYRELAGLLIWAAREEIRRDHKKAPRRYKPFLLRIVNKLTDPDLDVNDARSAAGLMGISTYAVEFSRIVGMNPRPYIEKHRMMLATKLLQHTGTRASITCIASAVGYPDSSHFSERYQKFTGHRPSLEHKADSKGTILLLEQLRREAIATRQRTPNHENMGLPAPRLHNDISSPVEGANALWEVVRDFNREQAFDFFRVNIAVLDTHHFDFILEKSKLEGRRSRERGEELAAIALGCLRAIEFREGRDFWDEKVLGYAMLANARLLRLDFVGANEAFEAIDTIKPAALRRSVLLQVNIIRAYFLWRWKRDVNSSKQMVESLLSEVRGSGSFEFLAMTLDLAGQIYETSGQFDHALSMFEERVECSRFIHDPYVTVSAYYNLSYLYASLGYGQKASEIFQTVKDLHEEADLNGMAIYVTLLEGRIHRANGVLRHAETAFLEAREGFRGLGIDIYVALTSLELALLYLDLAEPGRAFSMAMSSIDCISQYSYRREAMTALAVLQEASKSSIVNKTLLRRALSHVEMIRTDPTSGESAAQ